MTKTLSINLLRSLPEQIEEEDPTGEPTELDTPGKMAVKWK